MIVKLNDTVCKIHQDQASKLYYVDYDGQATSGSSIDELIAKLKERYQTVTLNEQ